MTSKPKRGEIWWVDLNPTVGAEMEKLRPALVISSDALQSLPLSIVAPITNWKKSFENNIWHVMLEADDVNGLAKKSAVTALQIRSVDHRRFKTMIGKVSPSTFSRIIKGQSAISPGMALRLSKCLGRSPESWLLMQDSYDLWQAKQTVDLADVEPLTVPA